MRWLAERLLAAVSCVSLSTVLAVIGPHGTINAGEINNIHSPADHQSPVLGSPDDRADSDVRNNIFECLSSATSLVDLYKKTVLPAIGQSSQASDPSIQTLLQQLDDAIRISEKQDTV